MIKRKVKRSRQHQFGDAPDDRTYTYEMQVGNRWLREGTEFSIRGVRGRLKFIRLVTTSAGAQWVDCLSSNAFRSFQPLRVSRVHNAKAVK